jgi:tRNA/rRNA methyltransferase
MQITNNPSIILINPQMGENIGMVARAMLNCGLTDLRIVNPRDGWPSEAAERASSRALDSGINVTVFNTTHDAIHDCHFTFATTARPRDMVKDVYTANSAMSSAHEKITDGQTVGILFGGERAGMDNDDIALSSAIITIPLNPNFTSLNLAQAVLLVAYEFMAQADATPPKQTDLGKTDIATAETVENFTARLIDELSDARFFRSDDLRPTTERNLRNLFTRLNLTDQDVQTFHGILSAFVKKN